MLSFQFYYITTRIMGITDPPKDSDSFDTSGLYIVPFNCIQNEKKEPPKALFILFFRVDELEIKFVQVLQCRFSASSFNVLPPIVIINQSSLCIQNIFP